MKVFIIVAAIVCVAVYVVRHTGSPKRVRLGPVIDTLRGLGASDTVIDFQRAAITAILGSGIKMLRTRSLVFGNTVVVRISPQAEASIRPVRQLVVAEILDEVVERAAKEGFQMTGRPHLELVVDKSLVGLDVRVQTAIDEDTPASFDAEPAPGGHATRAGTAAQPVSLYWLRSGTDPFVVPADGSHAIIGRSSSSTWQIDSPLLSGHHLDVSVTGDGQGNSVLALVDRKSTNGTRIDGRLLEKGRRYTVGHGSVVTLGPDVALRVVVGIFADDDTAPSEPSFG